MTTTNWTVGVLPDPILHGSALNMRWSYWRYYVAKCSMHPTYKAARKPLLPCVDCWRIYIERYDSENASKPK